MLAEIDTDFYIIDINFTDEEQINENEKASMFL